MPFRFLFKYFLALFVLFLCSSTPAQPLAAIPDSLQTKSYQQLTAWIDQHYDQVEKSKIYAHALLKKAKREKNASKTILAYHYLGYLNKENDKGMVYIDSLLQTSLHTGNQKTIASAYLTKGAFLDGENDYLKALETYLIALKYAHNHPDLLLPVKQNIGLLKAKVGDYDEALVLFKETLQARKQKPITTQNSNDYLNNFFCVADAFQRCHQADSAYTYNKLGYMESVRLKNEEMKLYFTLNEGANQSMKGNFQSCIDSVEKVLQPLINYEDYHNLGIAYYYLGKSYFSKKENEKGIRYLLKMDSLFQANSFLMTEQREGYALIIDYYKRKKDLLKQLEFTEKLIKVDAYFQNKYKGLSKSITLKFDTPQLISDKVALIERLENQNAYLNKIRFILITFAITSLILLLRLYFRHRSFKNKYLTLIQQIQSPKKISTLEPTPKPILKNKDLDFPLETIQQILERLDDFEKNAGFLDKDMTQNTLAKLCGTNANYLSKVIHKYKNNTYSNYIKNIRITYAIQTIYDDPSIRNYKIEHLAEYFGFNNSETFSKAFLHKTGIYPSYFIKQIQRENIVPENLV